MSTTTTIYSSKGTWLDGEYPTTNNSISATMKLGQQSVGFGSGERANAVFSFDVSSLTDPSAIVQATLNLTTLGMGGSSVREIYAYRLNQDFVEDEADWEDSADGTNWSGGDDVGAASNSEITQYSLSAKSKLESYCDVGFRVSTQPDLDITELVKDAINKRSGTLLLWIGIPLSDTITTSGAVTIHSPNATTESKRPKIDVVVADRMVWQGDSDPGDLDVAANWSPATVPTSTDIAIFSTSDENVTAGTLDCWKMYIAPSYAGTITNTPRFDTTELNITSPKSNLSPVVVLPTGRCEVTVADAKVLTLGGDCNVKIWRTRSEITLSASNIGAVDAHSTRAIFYATGNVPDIKVTGALYRLADGCGTLTAAGNSSGRISATTNTTMDVVLYGGHIHLLSESIDDLTMYSGRIKYSGNTGAPIATGDVIVYGGVLDTRVGSPTFGADSITLYAGRLLLDPGQLLDVE